MVEEADWSKSRVRTQVGFQERQLVLLAAGLARELFPFHGAGAVGVGTDDEGASPRATETRGRSRVASAEKTEHCVPGAPSPLSSALPLPTSSLVVLPAPESPYLLPHPSACTPSGALTPCTPTLCPSPCPSHTLNPSRMLLCAPQNSLRTGVGEWEGTLPAVLLPGWSVLIRATGVPFPPVENQRPSNPRQAYG